MENPLNDLTPFFSGDFAEPLTLSDGKAIRVIYDTPDIDGNLSGSPYDIKTRTKKLLCKESDLDGIQVGILATFRDEPVLVSDIDKDGIGTATLTIASAEGYVPPPPT